MNYQFPKIEHIDDVVPHLEGYDEFIIADRSDYKVINYMVSKDTTFTMNGPDDLSGAIRRECRGIVFDRNGYLISRRYQKFFNINEKEETQIHNVDFTKQHMILEKADGSMITPLIINGKIEWATKMGLTDVSRPVYDFVDENTQCRYNLLARDCDAEGYTPIFEWCSRKNRIVVDYPEDCLILTAIRDNLSGKYFTYEELEAFALIYKIPLVGPFCNKDINQIINESSSLIDSEGWVIRFDSGHMIKIKSSWYLKIHSARDKITMEKNVIELIVSGSIDDIKSFVLDSDRKRIDDFEHKFWSGIEATTDKTLADLDVLYKRYDGSKKEFALNEKNLDLVIRSLMFSHWENRSGMMDSIINIISKNTGSRTKIDSVRHLWGNHNWSET